MTETPDIGSDIERALAELSNQPRFVDRELFQDVDLDPSSVLMPLMERDGNLGLLFVKRAEDLSKHAGEIAFPGGRAEMVDSDLEETALREATEEVGLSPDDVEVFGVLAKIPVLSGFEIHAHVGKVTSDLELEPTSIEITETIFVPLADILDETYWRSERRDWEGTEFNLYFFEYGDEVIWGATAHLVHLFVEFLKEHGVLN